MPLFGPPNIEKLERKQDVQGLLKALNYKRNNGVRYKAADALGRIGDARAVEALLVALQNGDRLASEEAARTFGEIGDACAVEALLVALQDEKADVRKRAAEALGKIRDAHAVEALLVALQDEKADVRERAAEALGAIGDVRAVEPLIVSLSGDFLDDNVYFVRAAADALGKIGDVRAVEPLIVSFTKAVSRLTRNSIVVDFDVVRACAEALGNLGDARAAAPLVDSLSNRERPVREAALAALAKLDTSSALDRWIVALSVRDIRVRARAANVLRETRSSWDTRTVKSLIALLESEPPYIATEVANILEKHPSPEVTLSLSAYRNRLSTYRSQIEHLPFNSLVDELTYIGQNTGYLTYIGVPVANPADFADGCNIRAREIGAVLNQRGGKNLMLNAHDQVVAVLGRTIGRALEKAWDGIGDWWG